MPTVEEVVKLFKKHNPATPEEARKLTGLKLKYLGEGCFRDAYRIKGTDLVVKFPLWGEYEGIDHSCSEIDTVKKVKRMAKYKPLRMFLPEFYYTDYGTGVIIMEYCKKLGYGREKIADLIDSFVSSILGCDRYGSDMHYNNIGVKVTEDEWGCKTTEYKIIDFGIFE